MTYTAPASKVLTVVHLQDPGAQATEKPEASDGMTRCGLPLLVAELWIPVDLRTGDSLCRKCQGITDDQGAMW